MLGQGPSLSASYLLPFVPGRWAGVPGEGAKPSSGEAPPRPSAGWVPTEYVGSFLLSNLGLRREAVKLHWQERVGVLALFPHPTRPPLRGSREGQMIAASERPPPNSSSSFGGEGGESPKAGTFRTGRRRWRQPNTHSLCLSVVVPSSSAPPAWLAAAAAVNEGFC